VTKRSERVPDDILSALIYSEINHVKAKKHGIVMEGFPKT
jgi:adenylate kinase family enzyme